jgi:hypothetical protein
MVTPLRALLKRGHATELGRPDDQGVIEHSPRFEVNEQPGGRPVEDRSVPVVIRLDPFVTIPVEHSFAHREGTEVVNPGGQVRQQVRDILARLPPRLEGPGALAQRSVLSLEGDEVFRAGHRLAVPLDQLGFVVPRVQMADGPGAEDVQDPLRPGRKLGGSRRQRSVLRTRRSRREQSAFGQHRALGDSAHTGGHVGEEPATIEQMTAKGNR